MTTAHALLEEFYGPAAVVSISEVTTPGRVGSFSQVELAEIRQDGETRRVIVRGGGRQGPFQQPEDAARQLLWYSRVSGLPRHPRVLATAVIDDAGHWRRLSGTARIAVIEEFVDGVPYANDLTDIRGGRSVTEHDHRRAADLARYLAEIHRDRHVDRVAHLRGLRELVGGAEGIMSVIGLYPPEFRQRHRTLLDRLQSVIFERVIELQSVVRPVAQVHGDFHPGNILFTAADELHVIDRGRTERDEPMVDIGALLVNYLALGVPGTGLGQTFLNEYLAGTGDQDASTVLPVHTAMRVAAVASPAFYPDLDEDHRVAILAGGITIAQRRTLTPDDLDGCAERMRRLP
ncbi:phosphotransferase family protein [Actinoplanes couchii]|uniref:Aminoglycoside phosphotransferase domain-containing protein n=1 Tax=Actinoplanes couchii TaxID=403638 RepID=A0ABQ3XSC5_9ACTN|nr:phosphotransferase [Actinoplanes couchii]MDR6315932.1 hypothetical protein [Actinoplanes couchii]GID61418.1 hypothetical protein Aco03nite_098220 [Actinoplanes couchii]